MKELLMYLGPPCGGKSRAAIQSGFPRFSVRHWFEPKRKQMKLPKQGTFLNNETVFAAVREFMAENAQAPVVIFDGFPADKSQFEWTLREYEHTRKIVIKYFFVDYETAQRRSCERRVCYNCDGGADPILSQSEGRCPVCNSPLGVRYDDGEKHFSLRWKRYTQRALCLYESDKSGYYKKAVDSARKQFLLENNQMDLHLHTSASDGTATPREILNYALQKGIRLCSITDHDTIQALSDIELHASARGINLIRGVEINSLWRDQVVHLLCYGYDPENKVLKEILEKNHRRRTDYDEIVLMRLVNEMTITKSRLLEYGEYSYDPRRGGWKLLNYLIDIGLCKDGFAYLDMLKNLKVGKVPYLPASTVIPVLKECGICILAHPGAYRWKEEDFEDILSDFKNCGIHGFECFHPLHSSSVTDMCLSFCRKHDLLITGGSDDHGNLAERSMGNPHVGTEWIANTRFEDIIVWNGII